MNKIFFLFIITFYLIITQKESIAQQNQSTRIFNNKQATYTSQPKRIKTNSSDEITYTDTIKRIPRQVVREVPADANALVKILNTTRHIEIRTWAEAKVKMTALVSIEEKKSATITDEEVMEMGGLVLKSFGNRVEIQSMTQSIPELTSNRIRKVVVNERDTVLTVNGDGNVLIEKLLPHIYVSGVEDSKWAESPIRKMIVYVPEGCRLDIDNKYTNLLIVNDIGEGRFKMSRSNLDARNFRKLTIAADMYNINISDADEAELELESGSFTAGAIRTVDLDSKNSEIDYEGGDALYLRSQSDRIIVDEIARVDGRKLYGDLRIGKLLKSVDIEGTNADIKIRKIMPDVDSVKINDKYADLRLPVKNTPNFKVAFEGDNSTVFAPFTKETRTRLELKLSPVNTMALKAGLTTNSPAVISKGVGGLSEETVNKLRLEVRSAPVEKKEKVINSIVARYKNFNVGTISPAQFNGSGGDTSGKHTVFNITCNQCTVDFK